MTRRPGPLDLLSGRTDRAARVKPWLARGAEELQTPLQRRQARDCQVIIAAAAAHAADPPADALARLADLEVYLQESPFGAKRLRSAGNFLAAILHEHHGDTQAALIAWQRLQDTMAPNLLTTALREEGRLLDQLGRHDEATAVFRRYLVLREDAEPRLRAMDEPIRQRVAAAVKRPPRDCRRRSSLLVNPPRSLEAIPWFMNTARTRLPRVSVGCHSA
ncbi:hypothetical protein BH23GEM9_BH23GEM9_03530 [soil metagenome]